MEQLRVLAALPRLAVLNLHCTTWAKDAVSTGLSVLAASLPCLRVLNAPSDALLRTTLCARVGGTSFRHQCLAETAETMLGHL